MNNQYLPLTEYSTKHKVSISTLRRRIKADDIEFLFQDGKYFILDKPMSTHQRVHRPSPRTSEETLVSAHNGNVVKEAAPAFSFNTSMDFVETPQSQAQSNANGLQASLSEKSVLEAANQLLNELKKAYSSILQDKEEQILQLRTEVSDLKTLVRVLESDNDRLNRANR